MIVQIRSRDPMPHSVGIRNEWTQENKGIRSCRIPPDDSTCPVSALINVEVSTTSFITMSNLKSLDQNIYLIRRESHQTTPEAKLHVTGRYYLSYFMFYRKIKCS
ncbi:hypothetical protein TNCV_551471 [Trichonephila clavipes]|nr:hypothetical protein TNCV_551471 [Trichonephila clavipes]